MTFRNSFAFNMLEISIWVSKLVKILQIQLRLFILYPLFGCNQYHAISGPRPINSRCRSILQYIDRLNIVRVYGDHIGLFGRNTVDHIQRFIGTFQRSDPLTRIFTGSPGFASHRHLNPPALSPARQKRHSSPVPFSRSAAPTEDTEPVKPLSRVVPYPTTTTCPASLKPPALK